VQHAVTDEPALTLVFERSGRRVKVDMRDEILLGRADQTRGISPDVDLGQDGGYEAGVSRRHAILFYRDGVYGVEDLGSANGTFVNGQRLGSQQVSALAHGDELRCGTLRMRIEIVDS
jgi:pSer/pThr/pTyr-binding forkhead associated (FHA) protein